VLAYLVGYDFGYAWPWNYGHLFLALVFAGATWLGWRRLPRWALAPTAAIAVWAFAGFLIVQFAFRFNLPQLLPTQQFLAGANGSGAAPAKVLDIGSGSGRTTVMVLRARPATHVTALDNFSADYIRNNGPDLLKRNVRTAGLDDARVDVVTADMRKMPMPDGSFDAVVSSYAIDHLNRQGIREALHETARVLKPEGEFLLSIVAADGWMRFVYGPLLAHMRRAGPDFWPNQLREAGFIVTAEGGQPGSRWLLCRKTVQPVAIMNTDGEEKSRQR
jgi:SAM-dependent methyltransferase